MDGLLALVLAPLRNDALAVGQIAKLEPEIDHSLIAMYYVRIRGMLGSLSHDFLIDVQ